ncbi:hypothetical protein ACX0C9_000732 [Listeria monocytogenes]|uniref:hypothetical protein n=1 Tax=Listeria monocytogenes TaxID=1639 RepID=UPI000AE511A9|nr:hypothetical protein [Listeria monocytogenes]
MEFHKFIKEDMLIYSWITNNFHLNKKELKRRHQLILESTEILVIETGLVLQERMATRYNGCLIVGEQQIIYTREPFYTRIRKYNIQHSPSGKGVC